MIRDAVIHMNNEQPLVCDLREMPDARDLGLLCTNLRLVDGRVRFDVNVGAAERVGVRFSSQLLRLAVNVRGQQS